MEKESRAGRILRNQTDKIKRFATERPFKLATYGLLLTVGILGIVSGLFGQ